MSIMNRNKLNIARTVITTLNENDIDYMGLDIVAWKYPGTSFVSGSLLTVESNHFAILKSRGAVLNKYETGQYPIETPDKPIFGNFVKSMFGAGTDDSPWQMEVIYAQRAKLKVQNNGIATSAEMAEMSYVVDYYTHIDSIEDALKLTANLPFSGDAITTKELADYAGPVIEQSINQIVQVTKMENINEHIHDITELCKEKLSSFLGVYGITLNDLKVLITPRDERMRELISLQAIGLTPHEAIRYYLALKMAEKSLVSAPNAAIGVGFQVGGGTIGTWNASGMTDIPAGK